MAALQKDLRAILAAQFCDRRGRRPEHGEPSGIGVVPEVLSQRRGVGQRGARIAPFDDDIHHRRQRRISHRLAIAQLVGEERGVVLPARVLDAVVIRIDASARSPRPAQLPAPRGRRPASEVEMCARRRESRRAPVRRPPRRPRRASRGENRAPSRSSACRREYRFCPQPSTAECRRPPPSAAPCRGRAARRAPAATAAEISAATFSVPNPRRSRYGPLHAGHALGTSDSVVAVMAAGAVAIARLRNARSATRCSSGTRSCRRTAGRTPPSRGRGGSAG